MSEERLVGSDPEVIDCPHCGVEHAHGEDLEEELPINFHNPVDKPYKRKCESCGKTFWLTYADTFGGYYCGVGEVERSYEILKEKPGK